MRVKTKVVISSLKSLTGWVRKLSRPSDEETLHRVEDIVVGCLDIVELSPTTDLAGWLGRRPRRALLDEPAKAARSREGRRAIQELLTLTISELQASLPFRPDVEVGVLPVQPPRKISEEHLLAFHRGRAKYHQDRQDRRAAAARRIQAILAG